MDRRSFLSTAGAGALALPFGLKATGAKAQVAAPGDAALNALFDKIFDETVDNAPGFATSLGLDKGAKADLRKTFDPKPAQQARAEGVARTKRQLAAVRAVNPATLSTNGKLNREIVIYDAERSLTASTRFDLDGVQSPYMITQQDGAYFSIPDFLDSTHPVDSASDAEAYLSRLAEFRAARGHVDLALRDLELHRVRSFVRQQRNALDRVRQPIAIELDLLVVSLRNHPFIGGKLPIDESRRQ